MYDEIINNLNLLRQGKVREVYDLGEQLLIVASDRISAFDVIMNERIIGKGKILSTISKFWFGKTEHIIPNHYINDDLLQIPDLSAKDKEYLEDRSMIVKKCEPLPVEFVVRGYIAGSGWKEYLKTQTVCDIPLPSGLKKYEKLPEPIFTPATKATDGHDENINFERAQEILGKETAEHLKNISIALYKFGHDYLDERGIILADTKFEFGMFEGEPILIDEALTPDSSRFWLKEHYEPGKEQYNFDKQVLRDYLESTDWNKTPPPPVLPNKIINQTLDKYKEALVRLLS